MFRGTTPTIAMKINVNFDELARVWVTFSQKNEELFTLEKERFEYDREKKLIKATLTQEETLMFDSNYKLHVQLRVSENDDGSRAYAGRINRVNVDDILKDGVISNVQQTD